MKPASASLVLAILVFGGCDRQLPPQNEPTPADTRKILDALNALRAAESVEPILDLVDLSAIAHIGLDAGLPADQRAMAMDAIKSNINVHLYVHWDDAHRPGGDVRFEVASVAGLGPQPRAPAVVARLVYPNGGFDFFVFQVGNSGEPPQARIVEMADLRDGALSSTPVDEYIRWRLPKDVAAQRTREVEKRTARFQRQMPTLDLLDEQAKAMRADEVSAGVDKLRAQGLVDAQLEVFRAGVLIDAKRYDQARHALATARQLEPTLWTIERAAERLYVATQDHKALTDLYERYIDDGVLEMEVIWASEVFAAYRQSPDFQRLRRHASRASKRAGNGYEVLEVLNVRRAPGFLYYLDRNVDVVRTKHSKTKTHRDQTPEVVRRTKVRKREEGWFYILSLDGHLARIQENPTPPPTGDGDDAVRWARFSTRPFEDQSRSIRRNVPLSEALRGR